MAKTMTTTTTTTDVTATITITLSERRPIEIVVADWPRIARARWHSGEHEYQASEIAHITVREHADGRRIVYGVREEGRYASTPGYRDAKAGYMVAAIAGDLRAPSDGGPLTSACPDEVETVRAIRRVGGVVGCAGLAAECLADMPAEAV